MDLRGLLTNCETYYLTLNSNVNNGVKKVQYDCEEKEPRYNFQDLMTEKLNDSSDVLFMENLDGKDLATQRAKHS